MKRVQRLRGRAGQEQRRRRLIAEPMCRDCRERGLVVASTVPDHIVPLSKGGSDDDSNIRCLCGDCHRTRTAEQFGHKPPPQRIGLDGWPVSSDHPCLEIPEMKATGIHGMRLNTRTGRLTRAAALKLKPAPAPAKRDQDDKEPAK